MKSCLHNLWILRNKVKREHYINVKQKGWFIGTANTLQFIFYFRTPNILSFNEGQRDSRNCKPRFTTETRIVSFLLLPSFLSTHIPWAISLHTTEGNKCYYVLSFFHLRWVLVDPYLTLSQSPSSDVSSSGIPQRCDICAQPSWVLRCTSNMVTCYHLKSVSGTPKRYITNFKD
jgi:hypothetical protein